MQWPIGLSSPTMVATQCDLPTLEALWVRIVDAGGPGIGAHQENSDRVVSQVVGSISRSTRWPSRRPVDETGRRPSMST